jgi:hypothetical protein
MPAASSRRPPRVVRDRPRADGGCAPCGRCPRRWVCAVPAQPCACRPVAQLRRAMLNLCRAAAREPAAPVADWRSSRRRIRCGRGAATPRRACVRVVITTTRAVARCSPFLATRECCARGESGSRTLADLSFPMGEVGSAHRPACALRVRSGIRVGRRAALRVSADILYLDCQTKDQSGAMLSLDDAAPKLAL